MRKVLLEMEKLKNLNSGLGQFCFHYGNAIAHSASLKFDPYFFLPATLKNTFGADFRYFSSSRLYRYVPLREKVDVWHCLHQESAYLPGSKSAKLIVTIHDLNFLELKKSAWKQSYRLKKLQRLVDKADAITVISHFTESVVREHLRISNKPLKVIYNGNALKTFSIVSKPSFAPADPFFFAIGIIGPKKNFGALVPLLTYFKDFKLIIAGNKTHAYAEELQALAHSLGVADRLILPGTINDEEKFWLYQNCTALLFPSIAEGFGLPVVEAMSLGKPVFLSRYTSLPEIGGKEAYYFNSFDPEDMSAVIEGGLKDFNTHKELKKKKTVKWAEQFSWNGAMESYQQLYLNL